MVPKTLKGETLIPLHKLRLVDEELYQQYSKKYFDLPDRPKLLEKEIPKLNCLWNDVIHFLPLHPSFVYKALKIVGINVKTDLLFYKIPISHLKNNRNVEYTYRKETYRGPSAELNPEDIHILNTEEYKECTDIPNDTIEYYEEEHKKGNKFGMFAYIPHILSLGEVNISNVKVINWSEEL